MGRFGISLVATLLLAAVASAQESGDRLDAVLSKIEQRMKSVESIYVEDCTRIDTDRTGTKVWKGELRFLKPNLFAISLVQVQDRRIYEMMISTGTYLYEYRPQFKKLVKHELPPIDAAAIDSNLLSLALCRSAAEARKRYEMKITKDDPNAVYIELTPKAMEDKREFSKAELVLDAKRLSPQRLRFEQPNGNTVEWRLPHFDTESKLEKRHFRPPPVPEGWETVEVPLPKDPPPRRPGQ
jgi:TIGR03009 family protein